MEFIKTQFNIFTETNPVRMSLRRLTRQSVLKSFIARSAINRRSYKKATRSPVVNRKFYYYGEKCYQQEVV